MFRNKLFIKHHAVTRDSGFKTILHSYVCTFVIIIINEEKISEKRVIMIKKNNETTFELNTAFYELKYVFDY